MGVCPVAGVHTASQSQTPLVCSCLKAPPLASWVWGVRWGVSDPEFRHPALERANAWTRDNCSREHPRPKSNRPTTLWREGRKGCKTSWGELMGFHKRSSGTPRGPERPHGLGGGSDYSHITGGHPRFREAKRITPGTTTSRWQSWCLKSGSVPVPSHRSPHRTSFSLGCGATCPRCWSASLLGRALRELQVSWSKVTAVPSRFWPRVPATTLSPAPPPAGSGCGLADRKQARNPLELRAVLSGFCGPQVTKASLNQLR